jgi:GNAT superfamily N-acetyltransferase
VVEGGDSAARVVVRAAEPADVPLLLELFGDLAEYEQIEHELDATPALLASALFGERPVAEALIATHGGEAAGYALFFTTFSSFRCKQGAWLEDLFVRPAHRRAGVGRALLAAVAARVHARAGARLEWSALDWNELALSFYRGLGARTMDQWITHRLEGEGLAALAAESAGGSEGAGAGAGA